MNRFDIGFPAPGAEKVGPIMLWIGFFLAPAMWSLQLAANGSIAGLGCIEEGTTQVGDTGWGWAAGWIEAINVVALVVALCAIVLSYIHVRRTRSVEPRPEGGVMRAGEGRARFMAVWGFFASLLFAFAIAFNTVSVFWGGLCPA